MNEIHLITGASGLLGGNLARTLCQQGQRVRILVRKSSKTHFLDDLPNLEKVQGDLNDVSALQQAMTGVKIVYHCAAMVSVTRRMTPAIWQANVSGTENILQAARSCGVDRLVHCSSVDALGLPENGQPSTEETPWNWDRLGVDNAYARSKYEAQQRVLHAARAGLNAVVVCPTFMLGPYDARPSSGQLVLTAAKSPFKLKINGGNNFVDVQDVVDGMIAASQTGPAGEVYILGHANWAYEHIFEVIDAALGKRSLRIPAPAMLARLAGAAGDCWEQLSGHESTLNTAVARLGYLNHYYDPGKAIRELDLPQRPVEQAVEKCIAWFRQVGMLPESAARSFTVIKTTP